MLVDGHYHRIAYFNTASLTNSMQNTGLTDNEDGFWAVASRLVGVLMLPNGGAVLCHVLGRQRMTVDATGLARFRTFDQPQFISPPTNGSFEKRAFEAHILRPAGGRELSWLAHAAAQAAQLRMNAQDGPTPVQSLLGRLDDPNPPAPDRLTLSAALAVADMGAHGVLVTHPLGLPTHLSRDLWEFAQGFRTPHIPPPEQAHAARFLRRRALLWRDHDEAEAVKDQSTAPGLQHHTCARYWQFWRPFTLDQVNKSARPFHLGLIGPCLGQQYLEVLSHSALHHGLHICAIGWQKPELEMGQTPLDLLAYHPGKFLPALLRPALRNDAENLDFVHEQVSRALINELDRALAHSTCSVVAPLLGKPLVSPIAPGSDIDLQLESAVLSLNRLLADRLRASGRGTCVNELQWRDMLGIGNFKDDIFTASTHNSPMVNWSVPILKARLQTDMPDQHPQLAPPAPAHQIEPAAAMAAAVLRVALGRQHAKLPLGVIFQADGLLWPGVLQAQTLEQKLRVMLIGAPESDVYSGVHEALRGLAQSGVALWWRSNADNATTYALLDRLESHPELLRRCNLAGVIDSEGRVLHGCAPPDTGIISLGMRADTITPDHMAYPSDQQTRLRLYLLQAPEFMAQTAPGAPHNEPSAMLTPSTSDHAVAAFLDRVLAEISGQPLDLVSDSEHLADLGLDSLGVTQVISAMEQQLGFALPDHYALGEDAYVKARLLEVFQDAVEARATS